MADNRPHVNTRKINLILFLVLCAILVGSWAINAKLESMYVTPTLAPEEITSIKDVAKSTKERATITTIVPLPDGDWFIDNTESITDSENTNKVLKDFQVKTGVVPYLLILSDLDGERDVTQEALDAYAAEKYHELYDDEVHFLTIIVMNDNLAAAEKRYLLSCYAGSEASQYMDDEAMLIFRQYAAVFMHNTVMKTQQCIDYTYQYTLTRVSTETRSTFASTLLGYVPFIIIIIILSLISYRRQQRKKAQ